MRILILFLFLSTVFFSCIKEKYTETSFDIKNFSDHNVKLYVYNADFGNNVTVDSAFIIPNDSNFFYDYVKKDEDSDFPYPFGTSPDSALIIFDNYLYIKYNLTDTASRNILSINSYIGGKYTTELFMYYYSITEEDYNSANVLPKYRLYDYYQ